MSYTPSHVDLKSCSENQDYLAEGKTEPSSRSQVLIYYAGDNRWWLKVTLLGTISSLFGNIENQQFSKRERRRLFQIFVTQINYMSPPLLADTVTEIILGGCKSRTDIEMELKSDQATDMMKDLDLPLRCSVQEDALRVVYPLCDEFPSFRQINQKGLTDSVEITDGGFWVYENGVQYVLKIVDRPLYQPRDTDVIRKELEILEYFKGVPNIVQAAGVAVPTNPYKTSSENGEPMIVTGILLKAYTGGSLQQALTERRMEEYSWRKWAVQFGTALVCFHKAKKTHMDIKPSNVVLDAYGDAVLIDIGGIGGITHQWCAPEIRDEISPFRLPFEIRQLNDIWAYGKLLSAIASQAGDSPYVKTLNQVADSLREKDPQARMGLPMAISLLKNAEN